MLTRTTPQPAPPPPPGFAETFAKGGFRAIDRRYRAKTERLLQWIAATRHDLQGKT